MCETRGFGGRNPDNASLDPEYEEVVEEGKSWSWGSEEEQEEEMLAWEKVNSTLDTLGFVGSE